MLEIRKLQMSDNNALYTIYSNKKITKPAGFLPYSFLLELNKEMPKWIKTHYTICLDKKLIGVITIDPIDLHSVSLGIMLHENYHHQGYGKQALLQYFEIAKKQNIKTIYADCLLKNIASQKLLESCEFEFIKEFKRPYPAFIDLKTCKLYQKSL